MTVAAGAGGGLLCGICLMGSLHLVEVQLMCSYTGIQDVILDLSLI